VAPRAKPQFAAGFAMIHLSIQYQIEKAMAAKIAAVNPFLIPLMRNHNKDRLAQHQTNALATR